MTDHPLGGSLGQGLLEQTWGQRVVLAGETRRHEKKPLGVDDPFSSADQFLQVVVSSGGPIEEFQDPHGTNIRGGRHIVAHREEHAETRRVDHGE